VSQYSVENDDDEGRTKLILISMNSFGELVTLRVGQLIKNLLSLLFGTLCCLFADVLVNSCLCCHGVRISIHALEDLKPHMLTCKFNIHGSVHRSMNQ
jgi:hypothetical protein